MARTVAGPSVPGGRGSLGSNAAGPSNAGTGKKMKNTARKSTGGKAPRHSAG
jgi:histone H3